MENEQLTYEQRLEELSEKMALSSWPKNVLSAIYTWEEFSAKTNVINRQRDNARIAISYTADGIRKALRELKPLGEECETEKDREYIIQGYLVANGYPPH